LNVQLLIVQQANVPHLYAGLMRDDVQQSFRLP
jgi:hypothetical protein